jgi:Rne/Rng family ribonuclease
LSNELIISATQDGCRIALLKDKTLVEFHNEEEGSKFTVGDIYLGTVKKVVQGLNAAFIDVGYDKDAFLHYLDLGPQYSSLQKFTKAGAIEEDQWWEIRQISFRTGHRQTREDYPAIVERSIDPGSNCQRANLNKRASIILRVIPGRAIPGLGTIFKRSKRIEKDHQRRRTQTPAAPYPIN